MMAGIAEILALIGDKERANQIVTALKLLSPDIGVSRFRQALLSLALDDRKSALSLLAQALKDNEPELVWIKVDPRFDLLRDDPRFVVILDRVVAARQSSP
jgi:hypothetical protein